MKHSYFYYNSHLFIIYLFIKFHLIAVKGLQFNQIDIDFSTKIIEFLILLTIIYLLTLK